MGKMHGVCRIVIIGFLLLASLFVLHLASHDAVSARDIYVDNAFFYPRDGTAEHPYLKISDAISLADDGDTIYIFGGLYNESLTVNKRLSIIGGIDNKPTVISFRHEHYYTVDITADFVTLENLTITDEDHFIVSQHGALVHITSGNVMLQKNNFSHCLLWGVYLDSSNDNTISGNLINGTMGVYVSSSNNNVFSSNNISNSTDSGVKLVTSTKNIFYDNILQMNPFGLNSRDCLSSNISHNFFIQNKYHGMYLSGDRTDIIRGNSFINNTESGINFDSYDSNIFDNIFNGNQVGLTLQRSGCQVRNNTIVNESGIGLYAIRSSEGNCIYLNHFGKNTVNAKEQGKNQWDNGSKGNYWSDYFQIDRNLDGIGDFPYLISSGGIDHYPLGVFLKPPLKPMNPSPTDDQENVGLKVTLNVKVFDPDSKILTVYFYNAVNDTYLGIARNVMNGTNASLRITLPFDATFAWYTVANDSQLENRSDIWFFTTKQRPPENEKPVAKPGGPYVASLSQKVIFNGSQSNDPDGTIIFYRWNFGDGSSEILDEAPEHSYSDPGLYVVTLTVVDDDGRSAVANTTVTVTGAIFSDTPPVASFSAVSVSSVNSLVVYDASGSYDSDGTILGYRWDFNSDGVNDTGWLTDPEITHVFPAAGSYLVTLEVKDNGDLMSSFSSAIQVQTPQKQSPGFEVILALLAALVVLLVYRKYR